ncbi:unnamed protein product [Closterium sp. Yama58-4]|nr:unnamed protein product [Closterium sp. Yama58-4]
MAESSPVSDSSAPLLSDDDPNVASGRRRHRVLMVCDFFFPNFGGVESHIYLLAQCLLQRGHKVVVLTHEYGDRVGVRYLTNGLKVYYAPRRPVWLQVRGVWLQVRGVWLQVRGVWLQVRGVWLQVRGVWLQATPPSPLPCLSLPLFRAIVERERIAIVHAHQSFAPMCHDALLHAPTLGRRAVFTDHSLCGFADAASIHMNKVPNRGERGGGAAGGDGEGGGEKSGGAEHGRAGVACRAARGEVASGAEGGAEGAVGRREAVGARGREEEADMEGRARAVASGRQVAEAAAAAASTVPSTPHLAASEVAGREGAAGAGGHSSMAVEAGRHVAGSTGSGVQARGEGEGAEMEVVIVVISRLVYRKGADLLVDVIPAVCHRFPKVRWIIGGDGAKRGRLEEMRDRHGLHHRVTMLGAVPHSQVRDVLIQGHIFLNSSLTEAFCIAILEAACCGLFVVATRVGGVPEVLPPDMMLLADPNPPDIVHAIAQAIQIVPRVNPQAMHERVCVSSERCSPRCV